MSTYEIHVQHTDDLLKEVDRIIGEFTSLVSDISRCPVPQGAFGPIAEVVKQATDQLQNGTVKALFQGINSVMQIHQAVEAAKKAYSNADDQSSHMFVSVRARLDD